MKLVITDTNWADEMDVWGFEIIPTIEIYKAMKQAIAIYFTYNDSIELSVGSNESIKMTEEDYIFTYKDITEEEISTLKKLFGHLSKGNSLHYQLIDSVLYSIKLKDEKKFKELCDIIYAR